MTVEIFYDYVCPYVYRAGRLMADLEALDADLDVRWRYFPLAQVNNTKEDWYIWEQPTKDGDWASMRSAGGLRAFWGAEAARQQSEEQFRRFHLALLKAVHEEALSLSEDETVRTAARIAELDMEQWERDYRNTDLLERIREDYEVARERRIFGTPTFVFPDAEPAYLKLTDVVPAEEVEDYWRTFVHTVAERPLFREIKRPH